MEHFRIYTGTPGFELRNLELEPRYAKILKDAEEFKMPEIARGIFAIPEYFHTTKSKMLNDKTLVVKAEDDEKGTLETDSPFVAKQVMDILKNLKRSPKLDPACRNPEEVIAEMESKLDEAKASKKDK